MSFSAGSLPKLNFSPGSFPTVNFSPGTLPTVTSPITFGMPSATLDMAKLNTLTTRFVSGAPTDSDFERKAVLVKGAVMLKDGVGAAIMSARVAFNNGGVTYESGSGDYAEWLERLDPNEAITFGSIVGVHAGKISKKTAGADQVLVVSFKPIVLGNMPEAGKEEISEKVAFMGQVPVKVLGKVKKGDYIIPSELENGFGRAVSPDRIGIKQFAQVVGVAWGDSQEEGLKYVRVAVGLKPGEIIKVVQQQDDRITQLEAEVSQLRAQRTQAVVGVRMMEEKLQRMEDLAARLEQLEQRNSSIQRAVYTRRSPQSAVTAE